MGLRIPEEENHQFQIYALVSMDLLWMTRNKAIQEDSVPDPRKPVEQVRRVSSEHSKAWSNKIGVPDVREEWKPPPEGIIKINFDTAIREEFSSVAAIGRDWKGKTVFACAEIDPPVDPNVGETYAAQLGVKKALDLGFPKVMIEGDSMIVTSAIQRPILVEDWAISPIISDISDTLSKLAQWSAAKIHRFGTQQARAFSVGSSNPLR